MSINPLVSVCCITYNHEKYIGNAIEGFLMQKTDFPIEIIIHDDCSTDDTAKIVREYQQKYPQLIYLILQTENQYSKGKMIIPIPLKIARGKYIALCEGDDYWTDPDKLQNQVDFLESNSDYVICFHNVLVVYEEGFKQEHLRDNSAWDTYSIEQMILSNDFTNPGNVTPGHTCSVLFRNHVLNNFPSWLNKSWSDDLPLFILLTNYGLAKYINKVMGVHIIHPQGTSQAHSGIGFHFNRIEMYREINQYLDYKYHNLIKPIIVRHYIAIARTYGSKLKHMLKMISR